MVNDLYTHYTIVASPAIDSTIVWPNLYAYRWIPTNTYSEKQKGTYLPTYLQLPVVSPTLV